MNGLKSFGCRIKSSDVGRTMSRSPPELYFDEDMDENDFCVCGGVNTPGTECAKFNIAGDGEKGLQQTADYADSCGAAQAHLLIFDRHSDNSWDDKIWHQPQHQVGERVIEVWGA